LGSIFMFCATGLVFDGSGGFVSSFHVLCSRNRFRRNRGHQVSFLSFALLDSFSVVPRASSLVFMFCAPELVFDGSVGVGSSFHVFHSRTLFWWHRVRQVLFLCFALLDSFLAVPRASGPVSMFCATRLVFIGTEGLESCIHVFRSRTSFRQNRGRLVRLSCFPLSDSFSAVLRRRVMFSCFAPPDSFSAVEGASGPIFMFCAPGLVFGGTRGVGSSFHVLRSQTCFRQ
jgi:hypothetical protein